MPTTTKQQASEQEFYSNFYQELDGDDLTYLSLVKEKQKRKKHWEE